MAKNQLPFLNENIQIRVYRFCGTRLNPIFHMAVQDPIGCCQYRFFYKTLSVRVTASTSAGTAINGSCSSAAARRSANSAISKPRVAVGKNIAVGNGKGVKTIPLTRDFRETIQVRLKSDPCFREALLEEGVECLLAGDFDTGKSILRDYINGTLGFAELGCMTDKSPKNLMRMLGPNGNPNARNLFQIIGCLQAREGFNLKVQVVR